MVTIIYGSSKFGYKMVGDKNFTKARKKIKLWVDAQTLKETKKNVWWLEDDGENKKMEIARQNTT